MPQFLRLAKSVGIAVAISFFRAAMAAKRALVKTAGFLRTPFAWLYNRLLLPALGAGYRSFRLARLSVIEGLSHVESGLLRILANRFAIHAIIIVLSCSVAVTNINAQDSGADLEGQTKQSIVDALQGEQQQEEDYVEESAADAPVNADVSYMGVAALSQLDYVDEEVYDGSDAGLVLEDDDQPVFDSPMANAVRVLPTFEEGVPSTRTRVEEHIVQPGESLGTIARTYGIRVATLTAANQIRNGIIHPGDKIRILPVDGIIVAVKKGDTLNSIADKYQSSSEAIADANGITDGTVQIGVELVLPGGRLPEAPKPKAPARIAPSVATNIKNLVIPGPAGDRKGSSKLLWPTAVHRITQYWRGSRHTGLDIAGPVGTAIYASDDGVVLKAEWNKGGYGYMIVVDHGGGVFTRYGHCSKMLVKPGASVKRGDVIALMGSTGRSTGPHLHYEVMTGTLSHRVNPLEWTK